jgi:hypothetical protein
MKWFPHISRTGRALRSALVALALAAAIPTSFAVANDDRAPEDSITNAAKNLARMNYGTQIEWTTPDGRTRGSRDGDRDEQQRRGVDHGRRDAELPAGGRRDDFRDQITRRCAARPLHVCK